MNYIKNFGILAMAAILSTALILKTQARVTPGNHKPEVTVLPKVIPPPDSLRLDPFYKKYLNANGIAITASWRVPDSAMILNFTV